MALWDRKEIGCKWAPFLVVGETVDQALAMEFIRRTDGSFGGNISTNAREFEAQFNEMIGAVSYWKIDWDAPRDPDYFDRLNAGRAAFNKEFGFVDLQHLGSEWVASCYIGGPHGPVRPDGTIFDARNFGKYPSVDEIESDLTKIANAFPWLAFRLYVWDSHEEKGEGLPDFGWTVSGGSWRRTTIPAEITRPEADIASFVRRINLGAEARETTWSLDRIKEMWGDKIAAAKAAHDAAYAGYKPEAA